MTMKFRRGDDSRAFNRHLLKINRPSGIKDDAVISKAEFVCGNIILPYPNPVFPIFVDLTPQQSRRLKNENGCYLIVYDEEDRPLTCDGSMTLYGLENVRPCQK